MQLPPKRFQSDSDPKFDSIRHQPWFATLAQRREKIGLLQQAFIDYNYGNYTEKPALYAFASKWGVDERELRDYGDFQFYRSRFSELPKTDQKTYQALLDQAYDVYINVGADRPITKIIYDESRLFGVDARPVVELWDIDPAFYPTHYRGNK